MRTHTYTPAHPYTTTHKVVLVWLGANKLSLNVAKTKFMVFHTSNRLVRYPNLLINGRPIARVIQFNFLGLILQSNMSWSMHTDHISLKVSKAIGIIYRIYYY